MALPNTDVVVEKNGVLRRLFAITENRKGDVYITVFSGHAPEKRTDVRMLQHRFSIHPSLKSPDMNMIKQTFSYEGRPERTLAQLTNAIKMRTGFTLISTIRFTTLSHEDYDVDAGGNDSQIHLAVVDESVTMYVSVVVGALGTKFEPPATPENMGVWEVSTALCTIFFIAVMDEVPPLDFGRFLTQLTFDPDLTPEPDARSAALDKMNGRSMEFIMEVINGNFQRLKSNLLFEWEALADSAESEEERNSLIDFVLCNMSEERQREIREDLKRPLT